MYRVMIVNNSGV